MVDPYRSRALTRGNQRKIVGRIPQQVHAHFASYPLSETEADQTTMKKRGSRSRREVREKTLHHQWIMRTRYASKRSAATLALAGTHTIPLFEIVETLFYLQSKDIMTTYGT